MYCRDCRIYYKIENGEFTDDFNSYQCGIKLKHLIGIPKGKEYVSKILFLQFQFMMKNGLS